MIRVLIIIAVASFVLAVACFSGAVATGGRDLIEHGWNISPAYFENLDDDGDVRISVGRHRDSGPDVSHDLAWAGGPLLQIDVPAEVTFTQGGAPKITVSGPQDLVDRVEIVDGRLRFRDGDGGEGMRLRSMRDRLSIDVVAPAVKRFVLNGSPSLSLAAYDQPELAIEINGSGEVSGTGKTQALTLAIAGSGDANLGELQAQDANVSLAGSGEAELSARGAVQVSLAGSGDVTLTTKPASLSSNIDGSGDLHLP